MVINDTTGLHLAAGPYALFYSARMTKEEAETPAMWPKHFVVGVVLLPSIMSYLVSNPNKYAVYDPQPQRRTSSA